MIQVIFVHLLIVFDVVIMFIVHVAIVITVITVITVAIIRLLAIPITQSDLSLSCIGTTAIDCYLSIMYLLLQLVWVVAIVIGFSVSFIMQVV